MLCNYHNHYGIVHVAVPPLKVVSHLPSYLRISRTDSAATVVHIIILKALFL